MAKIGNIVRLFEFPEGINEHSLLYALDKDLDGDLTQESPYKISNIQVLSDTQVLAVLEEDNSRIGVQFIENDKEIILDECPSDGVYMSLDEVKLIRDLKQVTICDEAYAVTDLKFNVELDGVRYVQIYVKNESEVIKLWQIVIIVLVKHQTKYYLQEQPY